MDLYNSRRTISRSVFQSVATALLVVACFSFGLFSIANAQTETTDTPSTETATQESPAADDTPSATPAETDKAPAESSNDAVTQTEPPKSETTASNSSTDTADSTTIETGDARATQSTTNKVNINTVDTGTTPTPENASTTPPTLPDEATASTTVTSDNSAVIENQSTTTADTGENTAAAPQGGGASISTGDSLAAVNVVNIANANIIDSVGFYALLNLLGYFGSINLSNFGTTSPYLLPQCQNALETCTSEQLLSVANNNFADILNNLIVRSGSGGNYASSTGNADISTGDAAAFANLLNIVNTNIIDSNYLLLVFNNVGNWGGNIILPNKTFFDNFFFNGTGGGNANVSNNNSANVENSCGADAQSGGNTAIASSSEITTGNALSQCNTANLINTNIFGGGAFRLLIRVSGDWSGKIFGLPDGISWIRTPSGIELFSTSGAGTTSQDQSRLTVGNNNTANIKNDVGVYALTGENLIESKTGGISTGNAYAASNIMNVANTNVIGSNWLWAIINIFGNWNGNISFGAPDLWVGSTAKSLSDGFRPNTEVLFTFTIANRGDVDAADVILRSTPNPFISFNGQGTRSFMEWHVGRVPARSSIEVSYLAKLSTMLPFGEPELKSSSTVSAEEGDYNETDNTDILIILGMNPVGASLGGKVIKYDPDPILAITKKNFASSTITASSTVKYQIQIRNSGGPAYHSVLVDTLRNEHGEIVSKQTWNLGTIKPDEEITVDYVIGFNASTTDGGYINFAEIKAIGRNPSLNPFYGTFAYSNQASSTVTVLSNNLIGSADYGVKVETADVLEKNIERSSTSTEATSSPAIAMNKTKNTKKMVDTSKIPKQKIEPPKTEELEIKPIVLPEVSVPEIPNTGVDMPIRSMKKQSASAMDAYINGASYYLMRVISHFI